jgi:hypothetical protein
VVDWQLRNLQVRLETSALYRDHPRPRVSFPAHVHRGPEQAQARVRCARSAFKLAVSFEPIGFGNLLGAGEVTR